MMMVRAMAVNASPTFMPVEIPLLAVSVSSLDVGVAFDVGWGLLDPEGVCSVSPWGA